jgi:aryl-alcohol dehydrogenase-like predicted oxidoreductase
VTVERRRLGESPLEVSAFALGSWRTYERIPREQGVAVLRAAREHGIDFLEAARYDDTTGRAPIPTGYSEVVFGEVFRRSGWPREAVTIAEKLWWEFWPQQTAAQELDASLERTGLDHVDFVYSDPPPAELPLEEVVEAIGGLLQAGKVRAWGIVNWPAARIAEAGRTARAQGVPTPCAAQLPYSLAQRSPVEDEDMRTALAGCAASVVASFVLAGGVLTAKYADGGSGRMSGELEDPRLAGAVRVADRLRELSERSGVAPATLAMAFAYSSPGVATVLFGATTPEQVAENVRAAAPLDPALLAELRAIGAG